MGDRGSGSTRTEVIEHFVNGERVMRYATQYGQPMAMQKTHQGKQLSLGEGTSRCGQESSGGVSQGGDQGVGQEVMAERALNSYTCKLTEDQAAQLGAHLQSHNYEMRTVPHTLCGHREKLNVNLHQRQTVGAGKGTREFVSSCWNRKSSRKPGWGMRRRLIRISFVRV